MIDAPLTPGRNVVDLKGYRALRAASATKAQAIRPMCRHCGAALGEGESDDDCSSAGRGAALPAQSAPRRKFRAE